MTINAPTSSAETPLADPTPTELFRREANPRRGFVFFLVFAAVGAGAANMTAALLTLALKANALDATAATTTISISSAVAGLLTLVALPILGALSDGSRSRFGRRRPFLVLGAAAFAVGGFLLIVAPNVPVFVAAHLFITLGFVSAAVTTTALIADQLPPDRRGPASAFVSLSTAMGAMVGMAVAQPFGADIAPIMGIPTVIAIVAMMTLVFVLRDPQVAQPATPFNLRKLVRVFWVNPITHPSFALVFASRMLVFSGVAALNGYQAIYLMQRVHLEPAGLGSAILLTVIVNLGISLLVAPLVAKISDKLNVRKPFILVAAVILGAGLLLASTAEDFGAYLVACGVVALGQGVYFAVELALATRVLPDPDNPAKDLAIIKIADNLPVTIVATVAPALLAIGATQAGPNFAPLFIAGAVSAILGGIIILFVRGAR